MWETKKNIKKYLDKEGYFRAFYYIINVMRVNGEKSNNYDHQSVTTKWGMSVLSNIEHFVIHKYNLICTEVYAVTKPYENAFWEESHETYNKMRERLGDNDEGRVSESEE